MSRWRYDSESGCRSIKIQSRELLLDTLLSDVAWIRYLRLGAKNLQTTAEHRQRAHIVSEDELYVGDLWRMPAYSMSTTVRAVSKATSINGLERPVDAGA